jgi:hypothetical protein
MTPAHAQAEFGMTPGCNNVSLYCLWRKGLLEQLGIDPRKVGLVSANG